MGNLNEIILIADPIEKRFDWLKTLLYEKYGKESAHVKTIEGIKEFVEQTSDADISLIFISDDLPSDIKDSGRDLFINLMKLQYDPRFDQVDYVCMVNGKDEPMLDGILKRPLHIHLRSFPPTLIDRERIVAELGSFGRGLTALTEISKIQEIITWDRTNQTLKRQIRALSEQYELDGGESHLHNLIRAFFDCENAEKIEIKQLGQGKSGASVFRLIIDFDDKESEEYLLKLSNGDNLWKLRSEVKGHLEAKKINKDAYLQNVAVIKPSRVSSNDIKEESEYIANSGQWFAISYDFLGGGIFGRFIDLETALTANPSELREKTADSPFLLDSVEPAKVTAHRLNMVEKTLDILDKRWYSKLVDRRMKIGWKKEDAPDKQFIHLPPYQLTRQMKGRIQDFLDSREMNIGARLFSDWPKHTGLVLKFISDEDIPGLDLFDREMPFTLSQVHGDLNANNILFWLEHGYPFLIDLPFYQKDGHVLQDFARFETEIKFTLMDQQTESPPDRLAAFDHTFLQVPLWNEMDKRLLEVKCLDPKSLKTLYLKDCLWKQNGFQDNVTLSFKLILLVRKKACEIQQKTLAEDKPKPAAFDEEYLPALLYHTVRSIGYPSLSVFKRLLAVDSAGRILKKLSGPKKKGKA